MRLRRPSPRSFNLWCLLLVVFSLLCLFAAWALNAEPTGKDEAKQPWLDKIANDVTTPILNALGAHPKATLIVGLTILAAVCLSNGIRFAYPVHREPTDQPRWAAFILGFADPVVGNFWLAVEWLRNKFKLPFRAPRGAIPDPVTPAAPEAPEGGK